MIKIPRECRTKIGRRLSLVFWMAVIFIPLVFLAAFEGIGAFWEEFKEHFIDVFGNAKKLWALED